MKTAGTLSIALVLLSACSLVTGDVQDVDVGVDTSTGTVVELAESKSGSDVTYKPVVEFADGEGNQYRFTSSFAARPPRYNVGEQVDVLYDPDDPSDASLGAAPAVWAGPIVLLVIAGFLTVTGVLLVTVVKSMIRKKRERWHDEQELRDPELISPGRST